MNFNKYLQFLLDIGIRQFPRTHYPLRTFVAIQVTIHRLGTSSGALEARVKKYQLRKFNKVTPLSLPPSPSHLPGFHPIKNSNHGSHYSHYMFWKPMLD